ncbi:MAG: hypothetical protein HQK63_17580 [Desulfamplus sp.]|nr:hypothetical protein [Desulfamplus sp.]
MKIKEQTISALNDLTAAELMIVNEWINQLRPASPLPQKKRWAISYEQIHSAMSKCKSSFCDDIINQREERF